MVNDGMPAGTEASAELPEETSASEGSLSEDVIALIGDGRTYIEAEIAFQKTRFAYAADHGKSGIVLGVCAFAVLHLGLIALVVGLIFALSPLIGAGGATALVAGILLFAGAILGLKAKAQFNRLGEAFKGADE